MAADTNAPGRVRNFILEVARSPEFPKMGEGYNRNVRGPSNMIKKDQLIASVNATLWLGTGTRARERIRASLTSRLVVSHCPFQPHPFTSLKTKEV
jgi:hypothetical protein